MTDASRESAAKDALKAALNAAVTAIDSSAMQGAVFCGSWSGTTVPSVGLTDTFVRNLLAQRTKEGATSPNYMQVLLYVMLTPSLSEGSRKFALQLVLEDMQRQHGLSPLVE